MLLFHYLFIYLPFYSILGASHETERLRQSLASSNLAIPRARCTDSLGRSRIDLEDLISISSASSERVDADATRESRVVFHPRRLRRRLPLSNQIDLRLDSLLLFPLFSSAIPPLPLFLASPENARSEGRVLIFSRLPRLDLAGDSTPTSTMSTSPNSRVVGGRNVDFGKGNVHPLSPPFAHRCAVHIQTAFSRSTSCRLPPFRNRAFLHAYMCVCVCVCVCVWNTHIARIETRAHTQIVS